MRAGVTHVLSPAGWLLCVSAMDSAWLRELLTKRLRIRLECGTYSGCLRHVDTATKAVVLDQGEELRAGRACTTRLLVGSRPTDLFLERIKI
ncbi:hypothetical protein chiPu_0024498 [Chiloscyllium punctatum]|uniref:Uncharacterized protein n=1 Tax=Chiloscyllium punctatum TaxID=137246 RepID=A0A401TE15_CHIPU|nr:hypothetical protein [Chiloscyllium punctatum]